MNKMSKENISKENVSKENVSEVPSSSENMQVGSKPKTENENIVHCINILIQAVQKGQKAGAFFLEEAASIMESIKFLQTHFRKMSS